MATVGVSEAKARFGRLLKRVAAGETVTVTRHGVPIARLVPLPDRLADSAAAIDEWRRYRDERQLSLGGGITIRELIEDRRR